MECQAGSPVLTCVNTAYISDYQHVTSYYVKSDTHRNTPVAQLFCQDLSGVLLFIWS